MIDTDQNHRAFRGVISKGTFGSSKHSRLFPDAVVRGTNREMTAYVCASGLGCFEICTRVCYTFLVNGGVVGITSGGEMATDGGVVQ